MTGGEPALHGMVTEMFAAAARVTDADLPVIVREDSKRSLLDLLASCAAGPDHVFWDVDTADPESATLSNAFRCHAVDFDPVHPRTHGHPAAMLFPALLPYYSSGRCSGADLIAAYAVGHEVMAVFGDISGRALRNAHRHPTCVLGAIAVSISVGRILGLDPSDLRQAAFLAAATTTGHVASFGSPAKSYQLSVAARNGHTAAIAANARTFRMAGSGHALWQVLQDSVLAFGDLETKGVAPFGEPWRVETTATFHKLLPICGYLITTVLGFEKQLRDHSLSGPEIESIHVRVPWSVASVCRPGVPHDVDEARFALGFLLAVCLMRPIGGFESSFGDLMRTPEIVRIASSALVTHDEGCDADGVVRATMRLRGGDPVQLAIPVNGDGVLLDGDRVVTDKWHRYVESRLSGDVAARLASATLSLETVAGPDWFELLAKAVRGRALSGEGVPK